MSESGLTRRNYASRLADAVPHLADALRRAVADEPLLETRPHSLNAVVLLPQLVEPELAAHLAAEPHDCHADALTSWVEAMASSADPDVENAVLVDVFEDSPERVVELFAWGPATRRLVAEHPPW